MRSTAVINTQRCSTYGRINGTQHAAWRPGNASGYPPAETRFIMFLLTVSRKTIKMSTVHHVLPYCLYKND